MQVCRSADGSESVSIGFSTTQALSYKLERQEIIQYAKSNTCCTELVEGVLWKGAELEARG
jgi:hypothetical protein